MVDEPIQDDSSYYEISMTAGQAFLAVVLLIASLAAAFAFGIVVGEARGKPAVSSRERLPVILEGESGDRGTIVDLGVEDDQFSTTGAEEPSEPQPVIEEETPAISPPVPPADPQESEPALPAESPAVPHVAQILSTTEREPAERLAATLIEAGFSNAYVERVRSEAAMLYRVRILFASEAEARGSVSRLEQYAPGEIWISRAE